MKTMRVLAGAVLVTLCAAAEVFPGQERSLRKRLLIAAEPRLNLNALYYGDLNQGAGNGQSFSANGRQEVRNPTSYADNIAGYGGDDLIFGGGQAGSDSVGAATASATTIERISGGGGDDFIWADTTPTVTAGGQGQDTGIRVYQNGIVQNEAADAVDDATDFQNVIFGDQHFDNNYGNAAAFRADDGRAAGDDTIIGGQGKDVIFGGGGHDLILGNEGADYIYGDANFYYRASTTGGNYATAYGVNMGAFDSTAQTALNTAAGNYIPAVGGNDRLYGGLGTDNIFAGPGDDMIWGGDGADNISPGPGNDQVWGGDGGDTIFGGHENRPGQDLGFAYFTDEEGSDRIWAGAGGDTVTDRQGDNWIWLQEGDDTFHGSVDAPNGRSPGIQRVWGGSGFDIIRTGNADDIVHGGSDAAKINTYGGDDVIDLRGANGAGEISNAGGWSNSARGSGGDGDDTIYGHNGKDILLGGLGNDYINGGSGGDYIDGGDGNDTIMTYGNNGIYHTTVGGGAGHDRIFTNNSPGGVVINAGAGSDIVYMDGGDGLINLGDDDDAIYLHASQGMWSTTPNAGNAHTQTLGGLVGGAGCDMINGRLMGEDHTDSGCSSYRVFDNRQRCRAQYRAPSSPLGVTCSRIASMASCNAYMGCQWVGTQVFSTQGSDTIYGNGEASLINAGNGDDSVWVSSPDAQEVPAGEVTWQDAGGNDTTPSDLSTNAPLNRVAVQHDGQARVAIEIRDGGSTVVLRGGNVHRQGGAGATVYGSHGDDEINGGFGDDTIWGGDGSDRVFGHAGDDTINGGSHFDYIDGGAGDDIINGNSGKDTLHGMDGDDTIVTGGGSDVVDGGRGDDRIYVQLDDNSAVSHNAHISGQDGNDTIMGNTNGSSIRVYGGLGDDTIDCTNCAGDDSLYGGSAALDTPDAGFDVIHGGAGDDGIYGGSGNDRLWGQIGEDEINGGHGNDYINGGSGNDLLQGGAGDDIIVAGRGYDSIIGGLGDDIIYAYEGSMDSITGGAGNDVIYADASDTVVDAGTSDGCDMLNGYLHMNDRPTDYATNINAYDGHLCEDFAIKNYKMMNQVYAQVDAAGNEGDARTDKRWGEYIVGRNSNFKMVTMVARPNQRVPVGDVTWEDLNGNDTTPGDLSTNGPLNDVAVVYKGIMEVATEIRDDGATIVLAVQPKEVQEELYDPGQIVTVHDIIVDPSAGYCSDAGQCTTGNGLRPHQRRRLTGSPPGPPDAFADRAACEATDGSGSPYGTWNADMTNTYGVSTPGYQPNNEPQCLDRGGTWATDNTFTSAGGMTTQCTAYYCPRGEGAESGNCFEGQQQNCVICEWANGESSTVACAARRRMYLGGTYEEHLHRLQNIKWRWSIPAPTNAQELA